MYSAYSERLTVVCNSLASSYWAHLKLLTLKMKYARRAEIVDQLSHNFRPVVRRRHLV